MEGDWKRERPGASRGGGGGERVGGWSGMERVKGNGRETKREAARGIDSEIGSERRYRVILRRILY